MKKLIYIVAMMLMATGALAQVVLFEDTFDDLTTGAKATTEVLNSTNRTELVGSWSVDTAGGTPNTEVQADGVNKALRFGSSVAWPYESFDYRAYPIASGLCTDGFELTFEIASHLSDNRNNLDKALKVAFYEGTNEIARIRYNDDGFSMTPSNKGLSWYDGSTWHRVGSGWTTASASFNESLLTFSTITFGDISASIDVDLVNYPSGTMTNTYIGYINNPNAGIDSVRLAGALPPITLGTERKMTVDYVRLIQQSSQQSSQKVPSEENAITTKNSLWP